MTLPELRVVSLLTGPHIEIVGTVDVVSSMGWRAHLKFNASGSAFKRWIGWQRDNPRDTFQGTISDPDGKVVYDLWGNWKEKMFCAPFDRADPLIKQTEALAIQQGEEEEEETDDDASSEKSVIEEELEELEEEYMLYDSQAEEPVRPMVKPLDRQNDYESQRIWLFTTQALVAEDYARADTMKTAVEEQERGLRRERAARSEEWTPRLFQWQRRFFQTDPEPDTVADIVSDEEMEDGEDEENGGKDPVRTDYQGRWVFRQYWKK